MIHHALDLKLSLALIFATAAGAIDATTAGVKDWEDISLKAILLGAIVFVTRLLLQQQRDHKAEMQAVWDTHNADAVRREEKTCGLMESNTQALADLTAITREQTDYFKTVTRTIVDDRLRNKPTIP